jgi:prepilin-type N-terminal cleavage/methylation domain-containing protein
MSNNRGLTLIEIVVVTSVVGILALALRFSFEGWFDKYNLEKQTKEFYVDLLNARARAMQRNRVHFVSLDSNVKYTIYEDSNPAPDGNGSLEPAPGGDDEILSKNFDSEYPMSWSNAADTRLDFSKRGISEDNKTICLFSEVDPDYDCLVISATRINAGKIVTQDTDGGTCVSSNCDVK